MVFLIETMLDDMEKLVDFERFKGFRMEVDV